MYRLIALAGLLMLLIGCSQTQSTELPSQPPLPTRTPPPQVIDIQPTLGVSTSGSRTPPGWTHVDWEGLRIAYPPASNPIFKSLTPERPQRATARLLPTCPDNMECPVPVLFGIYSNDGGDVATWVERNHPANYHDLTSLTVDGRTGLTYQVGYGIDGPGAPLIYYVFPHGTDILQIEFGGDFGAGIIDQLDFDPAPETALAPGQLVYLQAAEALDVWSAASGGQRVVEHPKLHHGAQVAILQILADAVQIRTSEGTEGWLRQPASQILSREYVPDEQIERFGEGSHVTVVHAIPLRQLPNSESGKVHEQMAIGTTATVYELRGDWLHLSVDGIGAGWARWYYDGQLYIQ